MEEQIEIDHRLVTVKLFLCKPDQPDFKLRARPIAECYQRVFGLDRAWSEGKICKQCSRPGDDSKWNFADAPEVCPKCGAKLEDYWPIERVLVDMEHELQEADAVCSVACVDTQVIGGCWGFSLSADQMQEHLNHGFAPEVQVKEVANSLRREFPGVEKFAYQDEIFVLPDWQRKGVGKLLFKLRHEEFVRRGLSVYVMRTKTIPPSKTYLWYHGGLKYRVIDRYPDSDGRVVMVQHFDNIR